MWTFFGTQCITISEMLSDITSQKASEVGIR